MLLLLQDKNLMVTSKENLWPCNVNDDTIPVMQFTEFSLSSTKMRNFTIKDLFVRQLVQLKSLTVEKALAITKVYPTPSHLLLRWVESHFGNVWCRITDNFGYHLVDINSALKKMKVNGFWKRSNVHLGKKSARLWAESFTIFTVYSIRRRKFHLFVEFR